MVFRSRLINREGDWTDSARTAGGVSRLSKLCDAYADKSLFQHGRYLCEMSSRKMCKEGHASTSFALGAIAKDVVKSRSDTVGLFVWHAKKGQNCTHQNSNIGSRVHFEAPSLNKPTVSLVVCTEPHLYLQDDRPIVRLLHYFKAHLI